MRLRRDGVPILQLHMDDVATKQRVTVVIQFSDNSHSSQFLAGAQRARYRHQAIAVDAINPRFKRSRMECEASHVHGVQIIKGAP